MRTLYLDMTSGISGDIMLSALLALGANEKELSEKLSLTLGKTVKLSMEDVWRNSILCKRLIIDCDIEGEPFRNLPDIKNMLFASPFSEEVKENAVKAFELIAEAESEVHGISINEVHFHEIGAADTIIDIAGTAWALEELNIERVVSSIPTVSCGVINAAHGLMPLPAPATLKILKNVPLKRLNVEGELITPTGAAILKTFVSDFSNEFQGKFIKDAFSTGNAEFNGLTNMFRAIILEAEHIDDNILKIEANIDDMTGEHFGFLLNKLMASNALDVCYIPAFGKKNRPLYILSVMAKSEDRDNLLDIIFKYSSTAGVRIEKIDRITAERDFIEREVMGEKISVKRLVYKNHIRLSPEWDDCIKIGEKHGVSPAEIMRLALEE
ncbi:MAG: nickel pincer cofactor biosynthesis protein LarC [Mucispirillum sp.]|nr:nickel pincer cofactor biosynthesis protein LarC [Mucispirillum sp.]